MNARPAQPPGDSALLSVNDPETVSIAATMLKQGGVVAIPTDTVYGFAASIGRPGAIERIYEMKSRPTNRPIPVLIGDLESMGRVAIRMPSLMTVLAERYWPGALTLVVEARAGLPPQVLSTGPAGHLTVAVRLPDHTVAQEIIAAAGGALAVTSANKSGEPDALTAEQVRELSIAAPDAIVDGGHVAGGVPSTIVSFVNSTFAILREGAIPAKEILELVARSGYVSEASPGCAV